MAPAAASPPRPVHHGFAYEHDLSRATKCPICNRPAYFIRHNGGSLWVDDLGWPWPKHPCLESDPENAPIWRALLLGIDCGTHDRGCDLICHHVSGLDISEIGVVSLPASLRTWWARRAPSPESLVGAVVMVFERKLSLRTTSGIEIPIEYPTVKCLICDDRMPEPELEAHQRVQHKLHRCANVIDLSVRTLLLTTVAPVKAQEGDSSGGDSGESPEEPERQRVDSRVRF